MTEALHIGTRGWDIDAWQDGFYDEALPQDWRFCYFSNAIRAVVIPCDRWGGVEAADVAGWMQDSDPGFRFVSELPEWFNRGEAPDRQQLQQHLALSDGMQPRLAARLWPAPRPLPEPVEWWRARLHALGDAVPLCVDLDGQEPVAEVAALLDECGASRCWYPQREPRPQAPGRYLVARMADADLKTLRTVVETLVGWCGAKRGAGLYFEGSAQAPQLAQQARLIAELMGV